MRGMMTKVLAWTAAWLLPLATMADVPGRVRYSDGVHYYRYQRIGYEILPDAEALIRERSLEFGLLIAVVLTMIGLFACLCARKSWRVKICSTLLLIVGTVLTLVIRTLHYLVGGVFLLSLIPILKVEIDSFGLLVCLCSMVLTVLPVVFRRRIEMMFPALFGRKIHIASFCCALAVMGWFGWWMDGVWRSLFNGPYYDSAPGWKYPTELSEKERIGFNQRLDSLPPRMREMIAGIWKTDPHDGSEEHAKAVVLEVLGKDAELKSACMGIPVELIVSHYFTTERWQESYRGHSFTHPSLFICQNCGKSYDLTFASQHCAIQGSYEMCVDCKMNIECQMVGGD